MLKLNLAAFAKCCCILTLAGVLTASAGAAPDASTSATKPNILLILADDLGFSDIGCYGSEIATPNIDKLAAGGVRVEQFYNSSRCCPSRAALLTGLHPHRAGVGLMVSDNGPNFPGYRGFITTHTVTLPEALKTVGYRTYMVGKWHVSQKERPTERGFDEYYGMLHGFDSFFDPKAYRRLPKDRPERTYAKDKFYATDVFGDYAIDFIREAQTSGTQPWFMYLAFNAPHFPLHALPEDIAKYEKVYQQGWDKIREQRLERQKKLWLVDADTTLTPRGHVPPNWVATPKGWANKQNPAWDELPADRQRDLAQRMAIYAAMVDRMDQNIGRVVSHLEKSGELDNTLILFLADNGGCAEWDPYGFDVKTGPQNTLHTGDDLHKMGGPGTYHSYGSGWANVSGTPFRLYKHYIHEGGISSPFIAHWPARLKPTREWVKGPGDIIDIMPTLLEVTGATYPKERAGGAVPPMAGMSLLGMLEGEALPERVLAWEHDGNRGIRKGDWKLVSAGDDGPWELYNLANDRLEMHDLADVEFERTQKMAAGWVLWARKNKVIPQPPFGPEH